MFLSKTQPIGALSLLVWVGMGSMAFVGDLKHFMPEWPRVVIIACGAMMALACLSIAQGYFGEDEAASVMFSDYAAIQLLACLVAAGSVIVGWSKQKPKTN